LEAIDSEELHHPSGLRKGNTMRSHQTSPLRAAAAYVSSLLAVVNLVIATRIPDSSLSVDGFIGVPYVWAFALSAILWLCTTLLLASDSGDAAVVVAVGTALLSAAVLVASLGTDSLVLLLNGAVLTAVGLDSMSELTTKPE
jgi:hypothetical protein